MLNILQNICKPWVPVLSWEWFASGIIEEFTSWVVPVEQGNMTVVLVLQGSLDLEGEIVIHLCIMFRSS